MGRERKTDATQKDKRREGPISGGTVYIRLSAVPISQLLDANVQSLFQVMEPGLLDQNVCHYPANHSVRIRTRPLYIHVIMTKQSRPFGRLRKSVGKLPRRRPLTIKEVYRHIQSQRCLDDFPGVFVCTLYCCLAFEILDAHICSFADQIANDIFSLESNGSM